MLSRGRQQGPQPTASIAQLKPCAGANGEQPNHHRRRRRKRTFGLSFAHGAADQYGAVRIPRVLLHWVKQQREMRRPAQPYLRREHKHTRALLQVHSLEARQEVVELASLRRKRRAIDFPMQPVQHRLTMRS
jgi:hypothetical protein